MTRTQRRGIAAAIGGLLLTPFCIAMQHYCSLAGNINGFPSWIPIPLLLSAMIIGFGLWAWCDADGPHD
jgi:hypothetical protein